jgi:hypothetical protein
MRFSGAAEQIEAKKVLEKASSAVRTTLEAWSAAAKDDKGSGMHDGVAVSRLC